MTGVAWALLNSGDGIAGQQHNCPMWDTSSHPGSSISSNPEMAVISLEFSSVLTCPKVSMLPFDKLRRGPGADQVDRLLHRSPAMGTAHRPFGYAQDRPAVDGRHLAGHEGRHRPGPINETLLELPRVQPGKHVAGSAVGGNAVGQVQKGAEPFLLAPAGHLHLDPGIRAAKHGADGNGCDVRQLAPLASLHPRVRQVPKALHGRCTLSIHHHPASKPDSFLDKLVLKMRLPCQSRQSRFDVWA